MSHCRQPVARPAPAHELTVALPVTLLGAQGKSACEYNFFSPTPSFKMGRRCLSPPPPPPPWELVSPAPCRLPPVLRTHAGPAGHLTVHLPEHMMWVHSQLAARAGLCLGVPPAEKLTPPACLHKPPNRCSGPCCDRGIFKIHSQPLSSQLVCKRAEGQCQRHAFVEVTYPATGSKGPLFIGVEQVAFVAPKTCSCPLRRSNSFH